MSGMKFNGEVWMTIPNTSKAKDEPAEFVLVKNAKFNGGIIPYCKWRNGEWSANPIPNRVLIRELAIALENAKEKNMDCGDHSCKYATDKSGIRTNGGCRCVPDKKSQED